MESSGAPVPRPENRRSWSVAPLFIFGTVLCGLAVKNNWSDRALVAHFLRCYVWFVALCAFLHSILQLHFPRRPPAVVAWALRAYVIIVWCLLVAAYFYWL